MSPVPAGARWDLSQVQLDKAWKCKQGPTHHGGIWGGDPAAGGDHPTGCFLFESVLGIM